MITSSLRTSIHRHSRLFLHTHRQMNTLTTEFGYIGYSKKFNQSQTGSCNGYEDHQRQEPDSGDKLDLTMYPNPLKRPREDDGWGYESFKRPRTIPESVPFDHLSSNRALVPYAYGMRLRKDDEQDPLQKAWLNMMAQRATDGPLPRSLTDLQRMVEPGLFGTAGPEYSNYLDETLPPDDLTSQPTADYLSTTLESPKQHDVNDVFRVPGLAGAESSRSGLPPRQLVVLDLNGSLLLRSKDRREIEGVGNIYSMLRRPYVGCLAKYLAHERTQGAVIVEHKPHKKVHHILPPDFDINWFNGISSKKKKKKKNRSVVAHDPRIAALLQLRQKIKANPDKFTLMCPLDAMVWSSVQAHNLPPMIDAAFGAEQAALRACWSRKMLRLGAKGYRHKVQTTKNLETIWWSSEGAYSARSTILIDDTAEKARLQPWNLLQIPEYDPYPQGQWDPTNARGDDWPKDSEIPGETDVDTDVTLLAIIGILEELRNYSNIPAWIQGGHLLSSMQMDREHCEDAETEIKDNGTAQGDEEKPLWCSDAEVLAHWVKRGKTALASRGIPVDIGLLNVAKDVSFRHLRSGFY